MREMYDITKITEHHTSISLDEINLEIKELLFNLGIKVSWIELFYRKPGQQGTIHADNLSGDFTKINWIYKGKNSKMLWFTINDSVNKKQVKVTMADTEYLEFSLNEVTHVHATNVTGCALIQVGIPHLVVNPKEDRYCLCFVLTDLAGNRLTMKQAQKLLSKYIE